MVTFNDEFESRTKGPSLLIWLIGATGLIFLVWAKFAAIDEIVSAKCSIVSSSRPQFIRNREGGIFAVMLVSGGGCLVSTSDADDEREMR